MSIKAVIFDLDDTLVPEHSAWDRAFLEACEPAANERGFDAVVLRTAVFTIARQIWKTSDVFECCNANGYRLHSGLLWLSWDFADYEGEGVEEKSLKSWVPAFRRQVWNESLSEVGIDDEVLAEELSARFSPCFVQVHRAMPGADEAMSALAGMKLAVSTNGSSLVQRSKLRFSGLEPRFDVVAISGEIGLIKPDRRAFDYVLDALGVEPSEAVMVGDSLERDVEGALAAGIKPIWLMPDDVDAVPDGALGIRTLSELPQLISRL